jgi:hypothetical protein
MTTIPAFTKYASRRSPLTFADDGETFMDELPDFITALNTLATEMTAAGAQATADAATASAAALIAAAAANFKGNWSAQAGAAAVPYSVYHSSKYWMLLEDLADVTAKEPGVDPEWAEIPMTAITKASGAEVDTGTDDAKYVTPKAMADSAYIKNVADDTSPQLGANLDLNGFALDINALPAADTWEGNVATLTAHENMGAMGKLGFINSSGEVGLTDADAAASMPGCVLSTAATLADTAGVFLLPGSIIHLHTLAPGWTVGGLVYAGSGAGPHTAGALNQTVPAGSGDQVQVVGIALAADILFFCPSPVVAEV